MTKFDFLLGHEPLEQRLNIRKELTRIRKDPLDQFLKALGYDTIRVFSNDLTRYVDAYWFYYLSMDRYLREMSIAARYSRGPEWVRRSGGKQRYTDSQRKLAKEYNAIARFLEFDLTNCLIHTRILLDRMIALSRRFLSFKRLPSFSSFNGHKKFFAKLSEPFGEYEEYAEYIRNNTDWFDMPIKAVRDKFVVHSAPKHMRFLGYPSDGYELDLNIILPDAGDCEKPFSKVKVIRVNVLRMSYDIEEFLKWFNDYGLRAIENST
ncbi:MAG: hypothetical protein HWN68_14905 [Desulfobacterales bacterium]|nr:hypothetical protein [Desulfobacterales bacterium]